jgi:hypothetical protein
MFMCMAELVQLWHESGYGINLGGRVYTHAIWADNVWLLDHNPNNLEKIIKSLTDVFAKYQLHGKPESLCYMGSVEGDLENIVVEDCENELIVTNVNNMEILGARLDKQGSSKYSFEHRAAQADKAFWSDKSALLCKSLPLQMRFERYVERIVPRFLHGCGSWAWSQSLLQSIVTWEGKALRRIMGASRVPDEPWLQWFRRATRMARSQYLKLGFTPLSVRVLRERSIAQLSSSTSVP